MRFWERQQANVRRMSAERQSNDRLFMALQCAFGCVSGFPFNQRITNEQPTGSQRTTSEQPANNQPTLLNKKDKNIRKQKTRACARGGVLKSSLFLAFCLIKRRSKLQSEIKHNIDADTEKGAEIKGKCAKEFFN